MNLLQLWGLKIKSNPNTTFITCCSSRADFCCKRWFLWRSQWVDAFIRIQMTSLLYKHQPVVLRSSCFHPSSILIVVDLSPCWIDPFLNPLFPSRSCYLLAFFWTGFNTNQLFTAWQMPSTGALRCYIFPCSHATDSRDYSPGRFRDYGVCAAHFMCICHIRSQGESCGRGPWRLAGLRSPLGPPRTFELLQLANR